MANVGPNLWYCDSVAWTAVTAWPSNTAKSAGNLIRQNSTPTVGNERVFVCTVAGTTTNGTEPTWTVTKGAKTTDNTVTWAECTGQPGVNGDNYSATTHTTNGASAAGSTTLSFSAVPANVSLGQIVIDKTAPTVIPAHTTVTAFTSTTVTISAATTGAGVGSGDTIAFSNCPTWSMQASTAVTLGLVISNNAGSYLFICTTAGTCGSSEPSWTLTAGTVEPTDGTTVWTCLGANASFGTWAAPFARIAATTIATWAASGDTILVSDNHAETQAVAMAITGGTLPLPVKFFCVDHTASMPVGSNSVKTGATVTTTGNFAISLASAAPCGQYYNGITFSSGSGANSVAMNCNAAQTNGNAASLIMENCAVRCGGTSGGNVAFGTDNTQIRCRLTNTTMQFASTGSRLAIGMQDFIWRNTASAITGATFPTTLIANSLIGNAVFDGVDLSALSGTLCSGAGVGGKYLFVDCKLNSAATLTAALTFGGSSIDFVRCGSAATDYGISSYRYEGTLTDNEVVVRTGGASDGTTAISYQITTTANSIWTNPFEALPIAVFNTSTGTNRTVTLYGIANMAAMPLTDQVWYDVEYLGSASTPQASFQTGSKLNNLASGVALTADTSAWDSQVTIRTNGETVAVGAIRKVTNSPGLVWFCTAIGTGVLAGSEPAGMGSASDGAVVTDGGATWRAGWRFSLAVVLSSPQPQLAGYMRIIPRMAIPSTTAYIDPLPVLS